MSTTPTDQDYTRDPAADLAIQQAATEGDWVAWRAKSCPSSISPEPFGEVIGLPRVYVDKAQYFRPEDAVAIAAAHNSAPAWLRRLIAAEEAILEWAALDHPRGTGHRLSEIMAAVNRLNALAARIRAGREKGAQP